MAQMSDTGEGEIKERQGHAKRRARESLHQTGEGSHEWQDIQFLLQLPLVRSIFDATPDALLLSDECGRIVLANQQAEALLGYSPAELLGRPVEDLIPDLYRPTHPKHRLAFLEGSSPRLMGQGRLLKALRKNKHEVDIEVSLGRVTTDQGVYAVSGLRDISARTAGEQALQVSEQRYIQLAQKIPDGIYIFHFDFDGSRSFKYVSPRFCELLGVEADAVLQDFRLAFSLVHPDDFEGLDRANETARATMLPFRWEGRFILRGEIRWMRISSDPTKMSDGTSLWHGIVSDITERKKVEEELRATTERLAEAQHIAQLGSWTLDLVSGKLIWSNEIFRLFEIDPDQFGATYEAFLNTVHPDDRDALNRAYMASLEHRTPYEVTHRLLMSDGRVKWVHEHCTSEFDASGKPLRSIGTVQDVTERMKIEADLRIAAAAFDAQEGIIITDANGVVVRVNRAVIETTGYSAEELVGQTPRVFKSGRHDAEFYEKMWKTLLETGSWQGEVWDRRKNGEIYPKWLSITAVRDQSGVISHFVGSHTDISERKAAEEKISHLAFYDSLTNLPNRRLLCERLQHALAASTRSRREGALLFIDLDNFKLFNDRFGHDKGDLLLQEFAKRLTGCIRESDMAARLGGDEFVAVLENLSEKSEEAAAQAEAVGEKILATVGQPYLIGGTEHAVTPSVGISLFGNAKNVFDELLKQSDIAMYQAKLSGRNALRFFDPKLQESINARAAMEADLRLGLKAKQFLLYYQPQLEDGRMIGAEVLIRWLHPERGMVSPAEFIPMAEETGLILPLGRWVLETSCIQLVGWAARAETAGLTLAVNVSARQFRQSGFVSEVLAVLESTGANPLQLKLELTESMLVDNVEDVIAKMTTLKEHGIRFSLDDFGTGYSSLAYLKRMPLTQLKIDQSFVRDLLTDLNDAVIARTVVSLGLNLGLKVIAEGVETVGQRDVLASFGCNAYQGYLYARPMPADAFEQFALQCSKTIKHAPRTSMNDRSSLK